jgi:hypothetical protein
MQRTTSLALAGLVLVIHAGVADAGGAARGVAKPKPGNQAIARDLDRSVKATVSGTPLTRAFVKRGEKGGRGYKVKAVDATLVQKPRSGGRAIIQLESGPRAGSVKSSTIRVPSRTRGGSELAIRRGDRRISVTLRDPKRGEVWAEIDMDESNPTQGSVRYYTMPVGEQMRTRKPVSPAEAAVFLEQMGGFEPAKGTRAGRAVAEFTSRLAKTAARMPAAERQRLQPLLALLTPTSTAQRSAKPAPRARKVAVRGPAAARRTRHPNAPLFDAARSGLRVAAEGTPLARQERAPAASGERAFSVKAREASLSQDGTHGRSSLHIENDWGRGFTPRSARVSVPGTSARGARLELSYTPHRIRVQLVDGRRGTLQIALDNDVNRPGGVRYSIVDLAGSGEARPVSPAQALDFVRDIGGFQPAPGSKAGAALRAMAGRLGKAGKGMSAAELAPFIAALGG